MNYIMWLLTRFKLWVVGIGIAIAGVYYAYVQIRNDAIEDFVHKQNEKTVKDLRERNRINNEVDDYNIDDTVERLRKEGWLRK